MKTVSLETAALKICGPDSGLKDPAGWVLRQIRRGKFEAFKIGRHYRMTEEQIAAAVEMQRTKPTTPTPPEPQPPRGLSLTSTSARRLRDAS